MKIASVHKLVDDGNHNAFTDLVTFKGYYYLTYRSSPFGHMIYPDTQIVVMRSKDGIDWQEVVRLHLEGIDLRDPHFLNTGDRLFIYSGAWPVKIGHPNFKDHVNIASAMTYSDDGVNWTPPFLIPGSEGYYFWRTAYYNNTCYITAKHCVRPEQSSNPESHRCVILSSMDGKKWNLVSTIATVNGDETALLFDNSGNLIAFARNRVPEDFAALYQATAPYTTWSKTEMNYNIGGPLLFKVGDRLFVSGRRVKSGESKVTAIYSLSDGILTEITVLPSGGDNSYPGFVKLSEGRGLLSYYSSHESKPSTSSIYLAILTWEYETNVC